MAKPLIDPEPVIKRYQAGESTTQIARDLGCASSTIWRLLVRHGIETRPPPGRTTHCGAGHDWNIVGWWDDGKGGRKCKKCHAERMAIYYHRKKLKKRARQRDA